MGEGSGFGPSGRQPLPTGKARRAPAPAPPSKARSSRALPSPRIGSGRAQSRQWARCYLRRGGTLARTHLAHPPHANCRRACDDAQALGVLLQRLDHLLDTAPQRLGAGRLFDALERLPGPPPVRRRFQVSRRKGRAAPRHNTGARTHAHTHTLRRGGAEAPFSSAFCPQVGWRSETGRPASCCRPRRRRRPRPPSSSQTCLSCPSGRQRLRFAAGREAWAGKEFLPLFTEFVTKQ